MKESAFKAKSRAMNRCYRLSDPELIRAGQEQANKQAPETPPRPWQRSRAAGWIVTWFTPVGSPTWQTTTLETGPFVLRHLPIWTAQIRRYVVSQSARAVLVATKRVISDGRRGFTG